MTDHVGPLIAGKWVKFRPVVDRNIMGAKKSHLLLSVGQTNLLKASALSVFHHDFGRLFMWPK